MKIIFSKSPFLSLLFALAVAVFWAVPYVCTLSFQEQYQLFLFTTDYFVERMSVPGGMADYIAEFVTQFNYAYVVGAVLLGTVFFYDARAHGSDIQKGGGGRSLAVDNLCASVCTLGLYGKRECDAILWRIACSSTDVHVVLS